MEFITMTFMTDDGIDITNIRAIRTMIPTNCLLKTFSFYISECDIVVIFLPFKNPITPQEH